MSSFVEDNSFSEYPLYDFATEITDVESDGKKDYSFRLNMMNNSDELNIRFIHADIMTPYASHLNECCNVIGKGYFVASNYSADDIYEYGKFYPDAEFEERLVKAEFEFSFLIN